MQLSFLASSLFFVAAHAALEPASAVDGGAGTSVEGSTGLEERPFTDISFRLGLDLHGLLKKPGVRDLMFMNDALMGAYNEIHENVGDDYYMLSFNGTDTEVEEEEAPTPNKRRHRRHRRHRIFGATAAEAGDEDLDEEDLDESKLLSLADNLASAASAAADLAGWDSTSSDDDDEEEKEPTLGYRYVSPKDQGYRRPSRSTSRYSRRGGYGTTSRYSYQYYGLSAVACNFCRNRRNLRADTSTSGPHLIDSTATLQGYEVAFEAFDEISKEFCAILKDQGRPEVFAAIHDCSLSAVDSNTYNFVLDPQHEEDLTEPAAIASISHDRDLMKPTLAITLEGLDCGTAEDCNNDLLHEAVFDALQIAYNEVNFGDDMYTHSVVDKSFHVVHEQPILNLAKEDAAAADAVVSLAKWKGSLDVHCRTCESPLLVDAAKRGDLEAWVILERLNEIEDLFCGMVGTIADKFEILSNLEECSLKVVEDLTTNEELKAALMMSGASSSLSPRD